MNTESTMGLLCESIVTNPDFISLWSLPEIDVDLRYASPGNFVGRNVYGGLDCAYLRREAAEALTQAQTWLRAALRQADFHGIGTAWWRFEFGDRIAVRHDLPRVL